MSCLILPKGGAKTKNALCGKDDLGEATPAYMNADANHRDNLDRARDNKKVSALLGTGKESEKARLPEYYFVTRKTRHVADLGMETGTTQRETALQSREKDRMAMTENRSSPTGEQPHEAHV